MRIWGVEKFKWLGTSRIWVVHYTRNLGNESYKCPMNFVLTCLSIDVGISGVFYKNRWDI